LAGQLHHPHLINKLVKWKGCSCRCQWRQKVGFFTCRKGGGNHISQKRKKAWPTNDLAFGLKLFADPPLELLRVRVRGTGIGGDRLLFLSARTQT
jgi:hypothetical protein